jgi:hypothetical protein
LEEIPLRCECEPEPLEKSERSRQRLHPKPNERSQKSAISVPLTSTHCLLEISKLKSSVKTQWSISERYQSDIITIFPSYQTNIEKNPKVVLNLSKTKFQN